MWLVDEFFLGSALDNPPRNWTLHPWCQRYKYQNFGDFRVGSHTMFKEFQGDLQTLQKVVISHALCQGCIYQHFGKLEVGSKFYVYFSSVL